MGYGEFKDVLVRVALYVFIDAPPSGLLPTDADLGKVTALLYSLHNVALDPQARSFLFSVVSVSGISSPCFSCMVDGGNMHFFREMQLFRVWLIFACNALT